jgi:choline dehydrogenase-like flavoprotein
MDPSAPEPDLLLTAVTVAHHSPAVEATAPLVDPNYLGEQHDMDRMLAGLRIVRALGNSDVLGRWRTREAPPGPDAQDDASLVEYLRRSTMPWFHPVGTCRMGGDQDSVVDPQLRVRGVEGLRVADAEQRDAKGLVRGVRRRPSAAGRRYRAPFGFLGRGGGRTL